ncbi:helix-turn-helix transcriptional regulator [Allonocardiopsis opalescens]|uniref:HTH cro/C1-type domain-containing protein n=1 Tax=Allonocardiopsis opalescens TaxID=1144618 RepID=A0A2T0PPM4_9ACTN|nr:helix-turn-helix transcriptional regulator [Allonocardiopsis opalescens]PRX90855.1 hypothetical protein CLV72_11651 [Allonocardiopsis opalescens]
MNEGLTSINEQLRVRRQEGLKITKGDLAWLSSTARGTVTNLEAGRGDPELRTVRRIANALGMSIVSQNPGYDIATGPISLVEAIDVPALRRMIEIIKAVRDESSSTARVLASLYGGLARDLPTFRGDSEAEKSMRRFRVQELQEAFAEHLEDRAEDWPVLDLLNRLSGVKWRPFTGRAPITSAGPSVADGLGAESAAYAPPTAESRAAMERRLTVPPTMMPGYLEAQISGIETSVAHLTASVNELRVMLHRMASGSGYERTAIRALNKLPLPLRRALVHGEVFDSKVSADSDAVYAALAIRAPGDVTRTHSHMDDVLQQLKDEHSPSPEEADRQEE